MTVNLSKLPALHNWLRLRHLQLIETLADTANMHATAQQMGLSQPAVSKMLREIEQLLDFPLFERQPRELVATELGQVVIAFARRTLNDCRHFSQELQTLRQGGYGHLRIGAIFAATAQVVPATLLQLKQQRPLLTLELLEHTSDHLLQMLLHKQLDLVIGRFIEPHQPENFSYEELASEPFLLCADAGHPLALEATPSASDLEQWPWVVYPSHTPLRRMIEQAFTDAGIRFPGNRVETASVQSTLHLLHHNQSLALLPESIALQQVALGQLVVLQPPLQTPSLGYGLIRRRNEPLSANAEQFCAALQQVLGRRE
ncbi:LysR substrate-binding domain-containing protein [Pseudomonas sp. UBA2684]|uniref:LysR substrate-binding domain-containing protein n=1 Tax=Pseudomonas sp. UBA2684 TaxID=1947311 RepID=UPI000E8900D6|nr:LysR substrate-binding domain-containing protein [Pseudomonas sp. UBA2684]HBX56312.1 LysR family transcriptional regulator [Pseudomonas sp.]|tara:strand:+ start:5634 stop:6578 length:945 start_codon:yes stop_codon:yes gene_type:complete